MVLGFRAFFYFILVTCALIKNPPIEARSKRRMKERSRRKKNKMKKIWAARMHLFVFEIFLSLSYFFLNIFGVKIKKHKKWVKLNLCGRKKLPNAFIY